mgnify:FL=1
MTLQERSDQIAQVITYTDGTIARGLTLYRITSPPEAPAADYRDRSTDALPVGTWWVLDEDGNEIPVPGPAAGQCPQVYLEAVAAQWAEDELYEQD